MVSQDRTALFTRENTFQRKRNLKMFDTDNLLNILFIGEQYFDEAEKTKEVESKLKRYNLAIKNLEIVLQHEPNNPELLKKVGDAYIQRGWTKYKMSFKSEYANRLDILLWTNDNQQGIEYRTKARELIDITLSS